MFNRTSNIETALSFKCRVMGKFRNRQVDTRSFTQSDIMHLLMLHPITSLLSISCLRTCGLAVCSEVSAPVFTEQTSLWTLLRLTCQALLVCINPYVVWLKRGGHVPMVKGIVNTDNRNTVHDIFGHLAALQEKRGKESTVSAWVL